MTEPLTHCDTRPYTREEVDGILGSLNKTHGKGLSPNLYIAVGRRLIATIDAERQRADEMQDEADKTNERFVAEQRRAALAEAQAERLREAAQAAFEHVTELEEAWLRGALEEHDGHGGTRSNRNVAVRAKLAAALAASEEAKP